MKRWQWVVLVCGAACIVVLEVVSWAFHPMAFWLYPSWIYLAIVMQLLPWPRSAYLALSIGLVIDLYAPAPFGLWMVSLLLLVVVGQWIHTTWVKQASALSVFIAILGGLVAATVPVWLWQVAASSSSVFADVILQVHWWQWPVGWFIMSLLAAVCVRILPSRYERLV